MQAPWIALPNNAAVALLALFMACSALQTMCLGYLVLRSRSHHQPWRIAYEIGMLLSLVLSAALCWALAMQASTLALVANGLCLNLVPLTTLNPLVALVGLVAAWHERNVRVAISTLPLYVVAPYAIDLVSTAWSWALVLACLFYVGRTTFLLLEEQRHRSNGLSAFCTIEAIDKLPEGALCYDQAGFIVLLNETMRNCLKDLGIQADLASGHAIYQQLEALSQSAEIPGISYGKNLRICLPSGETRLFVRSTAVFNEQPHTLLLALNITEEERLTLRLADINRQLSKTHDNLRNALETGTKVAENDPLLYLHSRVHDIIGQRLSILHRYLEDGDLSDESFARIYPLLNTILDDLEDDSFANARSDLYSIVHAFAMINVDINVTGTLPPNNAIAAAFVQVIREASTNAVKHAQATEVTVRLATTKAHYDLTVSNNGAPFTGTLRQGSGLPGMARAIMSQGGSLELQTEGTFSIHATIPLQKPGTISNNESERG